MRPPKCPGCGGYHRLKRCPNELAKKDHEFQKRLAADPSKIPACDYRDPQGYVTCGGKGHLRSHHKQMILDSGMDRKPKPSPPKAGFVPRGGGNAANPGKGKPRGQMGGRKVQVKDAELEDEEDQPGA